MSRAVVLALAAVAISAAVVAQQPQGGGAPAGAPPPCGCWATTAALMATAARARTTARDMSRASCVRTIDYSARGFTRARCRSAKRRNGSTGNRPYASVPLKLQGHAPV